jgi:hypothetical protein
MNIDHIPTGAKPMETPTPEDPKARYKQRLDYCTLQRIKNPDEAALWVQAIDVYRHLIECTLSHSSGINPRNQCPWPGEAEE